MTCDIILHVLPIRSYHRHHEQGVLSPLFTKHKQTNPEPLKFPMQLGKQIYAHLTIQSNKISEGSQRGCHVCVTEMFVMPVTPFLQATGELQSPYITRRGGPCHLKTVHRSSCFAFFITSHYIVSRTYHKLYIASHIISIRMWGEMPSGPAELPGGDIVPLRRGVAAYKQPASYCGRCGE